MSSEQRLHRLEGMAKLFAKAGLRARSTINERINILIDAHIKLEDLFVKNEERFAQNEERFAKNEGASQKTKNGLRELNRPSID